MNLPLLILVCVLSVITIALIIFFNKKHNAKTEKELAERWGEASDQYLNMRLVKLYNEHLIESGYSDKINNQTAKDLDIEQVFEKYNHTYSKIGEQVLWHKLHNPSNDIQYLEQFNTLSESLLADRSKRQFYQRQLYRLRSTHDYFFPYLLEMSEIRTSKWMFVIYALQSSAVLSFLGMFFAPELALVLLFSGTVNTVLHYINKQKISKFTKAFQRFPLFNKVGKQLASKETDGVLGNIDEALKTTGKLDLKLRWLSTDNWQDGDLSSIAWGLIEVIKMFTLTEVTLFYQLLEGMKRNKEAIEQIYLAIGYADMALATASIRSASQYCQPQFSEEVKISFQGLRHPLIDDCHGNNLNIAQKGILITGSNMSGKSTFLRTVGVNALMAQTIYTCFAESFQMPFCQILTAMRIQDDVMTGTSYYMQEVNTIGDMLKLSENDNEMKLFILDELYKGTNTIERVKAAYAVLSHLQSSGHFVLIATHDTELSELLTSQYETYSFEEQVKEGKLFFDYEIKKGLPSKTNAIRLLEISGYPKEVIDMAKNGGE